MIKTLALMTHLGEEFCQINGKYYAQSEDYITTHWKDLRDELGEKNMPDFDEWLDENYTEVEEDYTDFNDNYLVLTDSEADQMTDEYIDQYIDDCVLSEIPRHLRSYFDYDKFKQDCSYDGRGHYLSPYDGCENEETIFFDGQHETLYIYRVN